MHAATPPQHMSNAPSIPPHLNMMMSHGHHAQGPIFINQVRKTSKKEQPHFQRSFLQATSMLTNQQILATPMTFTLAQPLEVRHAVPQPM